MIKVREVNDFHHAKDAYLNIVVGNTYYVKFTKDAAWFVRNNPGRTYNLKKMFENETVKRGNETAWIPGDNGTICTVKKWMRKNNILFTRRAYACMISLFIALTCVIIESLGEPSIQFMAATAVICVVALIFLGIEVINFIIWFFKNC